jgi:hypothetical protein
MPSGPRGSIVGVRTSIVVPSPREEWAVVARSTGRYLVVAFFATGTEARAAMLAARLEASRESIGLLAADERGHPGMEAADPGGVDAVLVAIASALQSGVMPARIHFFDPGSDFTADDVVRFGVELEAGHAAIVALAPRARADRLVVLFAGLGGKTEIHHLSDRALGRAVRPTRSA